MTWSRRGLLTATGGAAVAAGAGSVPPAVAAGARRRTATGFARLAAEGYARLAGERVGVVTNPTGVTHDLRHVVDVMHADDRVDLVAVFGPEHGFRGTAQAGGSEGRHDDPATGLPVYDTYRLRGEALARVFRTAGVDTVVFDVQDVGARFYTYVWTLYDCMEAAELAGKRVVVLDRPNPVSGRGAHGPVLREEFATFVGRKPLAQAHGMTVAELARLFNREYLERPVELDTVLMSGWRRADFHGATGLPWVPPSPNMPTPKTALVYAGTCLFEGTNLSEGRGTTRPFELLGAQGLDGRWAAAANGTGLPGVRLREAYFVPAFGKFANTTVGGVQLHVHDRTAFDPVRTGIGLLITAKRTWRDFRWRFDPGPGTFWVDHLTGSPLVRTAIDGGAEVDEVVAAWRAELSGFRAVRRRYLSYD
ncbi:DUF1343 domain-containing protein [Streptomyces sp. NPDC002490]|uniref:exo-beta-N-acetylmuramidase NamZ family protein n=1 Tax=Streptomyces sp. NPDC002490 TaxID=3154416 RepID=UPI0033199D99